MLSREKGAVVSRKSVCEVSWSDVFGKLKERGVQEIGLVISDGLVGIEQAGASHFSGAWH